MGSGNVKGRVAESDLCLTIGISGAIPKLIAYRLVELVLHMSEELTILAAGTRLFIGIVALH